MNFEVGKIYTKPIGLSLEDFKTLEGFLTFEHPIYVAGEKGTESVSLIFEDGGFYTGLLPTLLNRLDEAEIEYEVKYDYKPSKINVDKITPKLKGIKFRKYQTEGVKALIKARRGLLWAATASGKTEIIISTVKELLDSGKAKKALIVCGTAELMYQISERFVKRGMKDVDIFGGGEESELESTITVATVQTIFSRLKRGQVRLDHDIFIMDEAHHGASTSWGAIGESCNAEFRFGFSATPFSNREQTPTTANDFKLIGLTGPIVYDVQLPFLIEKDFIAQPKVSMIPIDRFYVKSFNWRSVYSKGIVNNAYRNTVIAELALSLFKNNLKTLILVKELKHGHNIMDILLENGYKATMIHGDSGVTFFNEDNKRKTTKMDFSDLREAFSLPEPMITIASPAFGEGIDLPGVDAVIRAAAGRSYRLVLQDIGRVLRKKEDKDADNKVYIFDFYDKHHPFLKAQSDAREEVYEGSGLCVLEGLDPLREELDL